MRRTLSLILLAGMLAGLLSGCQLGFSEDLYQLPALSQEYENLQDELERIISSGLEYAAPKAGGNTQPVQFQDLDNDGEDEVVAFFRDASSDRPLRIYIFRRTEEGLYQAAATIEGEGTAFRSVAYENLNDTGSSELVVNYQMSEQVYTLCVYSLENYNVTELLHSGCTRYVVADLDVNGVRELVLLQMDSSDETEPRAEYYDYFDGQLTLAQTVLLSTGMTSITRLRRSYLNDGTPALFVSGDFGDGQLVTDILAVRDGQLDNITLDDSGVSNITLRDDPGEAFFATDINGDSAYEIPMVDALDQLGSSGVWLVEWRSYGLDGTDHRACVTVASPNDGAGWYIQVDDSWIGQVTALREESSVTDEVAVTLYYCPMGVDSVTGDLEQDGLVEIATIYTIRGNNRATRSRLEGRFVLATQSDTIYAATLANSGWNSGLTQETLVEQFHFMPDDWSVSD